MYTKIFFSDIIYSVIMYDRKGRKIMGNIVLLDDLTINKIAAGEVIERPASVVKEMVENSIDAGSKNITVEIKNGGISYIKITDDGSGISEDDMEIAFERHATSKIRSADDLNTVMTMGFRGEALASIAAIANVEMVSKKEGEEIGHKIVVEGGKTLEKSEVGCPVGTSITVQNLFFNTPVRYKFLKKDYTEAGYIEDAIKRIALVNPGIAIKLINSGKTVIQTNGSDDLKNVIYSIYGKDIANGVTEVNYDYEDMNVSGVIGKKEIARSNRQNQLFFVNGRYVKDKTLTSAVDQAYKGLLPDGKFGFVVLNLHMDPQKLDVNVHPAKLEVRFQEENNVFKAIYHAIKIGFGQESVSQPVETKKNFQETSQKSNFTEMKWNEQKNLSIEERVNKINSLIHQIAPVSVAPKEEKEVVEIPNKNLIEDIYNNRNKPNVEVKPREVIGEDEKAIRFGNTKISSETEPINVMEVKEQLEQTKSEMPTYQIEDKQKEKLPEVSEILEEDISPQDAEDTQALTENKQSESNNSENDIQFKKDDKFTEVVADKLIEAKLNEFEDTQIIDTNKVKEELKDVPEVTPEFEEMYKKTFGVEIKPNQKVEETEDVKQDSEKIDIEELSYVEGINQSLFEDKEEYKNINYKLIGVAFSDYIVIEIKDELYMIHENAAKERIVYEMLRKNYYEDSDQKDSQFLLLPDIVLLTSKQMDIANENIPIFEKIGFQIEEFGENTIRIIAVPSICEKLNNKEIVLEILDKIDTIAVTEIDEKAEKMLEIVAAKSAEEMDSNLDIAEIDDLMKHLLVLDNPFTYPNGKPTAIKMTKYDLERKFSRK